jgi:putative endonuclease
MSNNTQKGNAGEDIAIAHLLKQGYSIRERNWRHRHLEIDIVAESDNMLVIVEVKLRASNAFGTPEEFVTKAKQKKLIRAADVYIKTNNINIETRFDVISIIQNSNELNVEHITGAFYPTL